MFNWTSSFPRSARQSGHVFVADDLVLMSGSEGLREKFCKWKEAFESKGLKVNFGKTKVVVSGAEGEVSVSKVDPCGINYIIVGSE